MTRSARGCADVFPVSTGLVVAGLPLPELMVQIDAEAVVGSPVDRIRTIRAQGTGSARISRGRAHGCRR